jgi:hypothetical protein
MKLAELGELVAKLPELTKLTFYISTHDVHP